MDYRDFAARGVGHDDAGQLSPTLRDQYEYVELVLRIKDMRNILRLCMTAVGFLFLASAHAVRAQNTNPPLWDACQVAEPDELSWDYRWRWRAEQNLSCIINKLDLAVAEAARSETAVTLSHRELQQLLSLAWGARDAAQRIGR